MAVLGIICVTLEVSALEPGVAFYEAAGLVAERDGDTVRFRCEGQDRAAIVLIGGAASKRLHHVTLRADDLPGIAGGLSRAGGSLVQPPQGHADAGLWVRDPNGLLYHLVSCDAEPDPSPGRPFEVNGPGRIVRTRRSAILPRAAYDAVRPLKLGHVLLFTSDVAASVAFMVDGLGMGLADKAGDVIAFTCARRDSDHHVVAFAKSEGVGFHHASFQVRDPDEVGRGGRALQDRSGRGDWGLGRHTIGSNFFHYIQDPWGSWFEYYADMDFIDDYSSWSSTDYAMEDSLASWGPSLPHDFVHNYETCAAGFPAPAAEPLSGAA